jgi:hypothetical protein
MMIVRRELKEASYWRTLYDHLTRELFSARDHSEWHILLRYAFSSIGRSGFLVYLLSRN